MKNNYLKRLLIFGGGLLVILWALSLVVPEKWVTDTWPIIFSFIFLVTLLMHFFITRNTENDPQKQIRRYMISILLKLTIYLIAIAVYIILRKADAVAFIICFFIVYLGFTVFENQYIFNQSKKK